MEKNIKEIGSLSRKTKINIFVTIFITFVLIAVFTSINQISTIIKNREQLFELQQQLNWERKQNIKLLAEEKRLYSDEAIELEARNQFNMTKASEVNHFVEIVDEETNAASADNIEPDEYEDNSAIMPGDLTGTTISGTGVYRASDLWENLKIFYDSEIRDN